MNVITSIKRVEWYLDLLEPLGLRWEADRHFLHMTQEPRGRCNVPLPPDGWLLLMKLAGAHVNNERGFRRQGVKSYQVSAHSELARAVANRFQHPAFRELAVPVTEGVYPQAMPAWFVDNEGAGGWFPFGYSTGRFAVLRPETVRLDRIGDCYVWVGTQERTLSETNPMLLEATHTPWIAAANARAAG